MQVWLVAVIAGLAILSILLARPTGHAHSFFRGQSAAGHAPGLLTLIFSQVTTWIFARSLLNAAILGFYYGLWGTLAYAAYYLSFLTGGRIIDHLRFVHGHNSVQAFLYDRFGAWGTRCYNVVIGVRLVSEVFANLLVIGILFGVAGSQAYTLAVVGLAVVTLVYSMLGGLHTSLRTDLYQMMIFLVVLVVLTALVAADGHYGSHLLAFKPFDITEPGPVLLLVALLQVWSYPMHDPVMMDRGFLADRETTRRSFRHAAWISMLCIVAFGALGIVAGANAASGESMNDTLARLLGDVPMFLFSASLIVSAMSTLDSTLASSAKMLVVDMRVMPTSVRNGRVVMALFMLSGLGMVFVGNDDLFSAVAVSGTASLYLVPVIFFSLWGNRRDIPVWSYVGSFCLAIAGAALYFLESSAHTAWLGDVHKYTKLLWICIVVMIGSCALFLVGGSGQKQAEAVAET
ncbi:MAG: sodium:proline symporter [Gammaproteobacteria bacterium]|nr:sodium:proline symporter [Gammaproteobacteria bacterium]